jgi:hypothetical protein
MLVPPDDDLFEAVPVTRDLLRTKEPGPKYSRRQARPR